MLDFYYPSLAALVAACREARRYLRANPEASACLGSLADYRIKKVLRKYSEEIRFINGIPTVVYVY